MIASITMVLSYDEQLQQPALSSEHSGSLVDIVSFEHFCLLVIIVSSKNFCSRIVVRFSERFCYLDAVVSFKQFLFPVSCRTQKIKIFYAMSIVAPRLRLSPFSLCWSYSVQPQNRLCLLILFLISFSCTTSNANIQELFLYINIYAAYQT